MVSRLVLRGLDLNLGLGRSGIGLDLGIEAFGLGDFLETKSRTVLECVL